MFKFWRNPESNLDICFVVSRINRYPPPNPQNLCIYWFSWERYFAEMATLSILRWKDNFALSCGPNAVTTVSYKREAGVSARDMTMEAELE